jgi:hypothetical protein
MSEDDKRWHLDRKVPIAIILTLIAQTGSFVWWAGRLDNRVEMLERGAVTTAPQGDRLTRLEAQYEAIRESLAEIKVLIRRGTDRP